jgi:hypothetical protein
MEELFSSPETHLIKTYLAKILRCPLNLNLLKIYSLSQIYPHLDRVFSHLQALSFLLTRSKYLSLLELYCNKELHPLNLLSIPKLTWLLLLAYKNSNLTILYQFQMKVVFWHKVGNKIISSRRI